MCIRDRKKKEEEEEEEEEKEENEKEKEKKKKKKKKKSSHCAILWGLSLNHSNHAYLVSGQYNSVWLR